MAKANNRCKRWTPSFPFSGIRRMFHRSIAPLVCCLALIGVAASAQESTIPWRTNLEQAKRQAAQENKLVLLHFWGTFCRPCRNLDSFVFTNPRVGNAVNELYVPVKVDVEANPALAQEFGITTIPHDVVITPSGQVLAKQASSPNADGYLRMVQSIARKAGRSNPQAIANAQQIAQGVPNTTPQITNAFVPDGQTSVTPEPIRMIGETTPKVDQPIRTVGGQAMLPVANDERKLQSTPPPADQFISDLGLAPGARAAAPANVFPPNNAPKKAAVPSGLSLQSLRPLRETEPAREITAESPQQRSDPAPKTTINPLAIASEVIPASPSPAAAPMENLSSDSSVQSPPASEFVATSTSNNSSVARPAASDSEPVVGFGGSCPATWYATGKFVRGDPRFGCEHRGRLYLFASPQLRDQFRLTPDLLSPMLAGYDPVEYVSNGELVEGSLSFMVESNSDQHKSVYLFRSAENKAAFLSHSQKYIDEVRQAMRAADQATLLR